MKYYIEIDERDIDRFRIDNPCKGSNGNVILVLKDKNNLTVAFPLLKEKPIDVFFDTFPELNIEPYNKFFTLGGNGGGKHGGI